MVKRGDVYWVCLDPTVGSEIQKTRPCLVISPDDMNQVLPRVIIAPITSKGQSLGCRPEWTFQGKSARILLDQVRTVDKQRLTKKMGSIPLEVWHKTLLQMFA
ncbi:type II toxin-antitoxin system PemK/MazF family toxin [Thiosulfativibrio zosterae]|uniref:mRNA interferase n=1 Tax=Thiosulfativibrio zosterae TaxID=2675053 RepID=A0A6F8PR24_9GAMM|nr:type II toxin-antitoxin system PemK/MazF family toxin [Thiosulfativibrio zosterae]BBP44582.1 mRNA interferase [Thiosulfativibrio zosterae]